MKFFLIPIVLVLCVTVATHKVTASETCSTPACAEYEAAHGQMVQYPYALTCVNLLQANHSRVVFAFFNAEGVQIDVDDAQHAFWAPAGLSRHCFGRHWFQEAYRLRVCNDFFWAVLTKQRLEEYYSFGQRRGHYILLGHGGR